MSRFFFITTFALTLGAFCHCDQSAEAWQTDPFGTGSSAGTTSPTTSQDASLDSDVDVDSLTRPDLDSLSPNVRRIVESVRGSKLDTPRKLASAVRTMMDLEEYAEARHYLGLLVSQNLDDQALFELDRAIGSDFFFRLTRSPEMAPDGPAFGANVRVAANRTALAPSRIESLIDSLSDENIARRAGAARELRLLGEPAIAMMVNTFADDSKSSQFAGIRAALQIMGPAGLGPLTAGARSDHEQVQFESVIALSKIKEPEAFDAIVGSYYMRDTPERVKEAASAAFERQYGYFPDVEKATKSWRKRSTELLDDRNEVGARRLGFALASADVWRWNPVQKRVVRLRLNRIASSRIRAAEKAEVLAAINPTNQELQQFYMLTFLESRKQLAGPTQPISISEFRDQFPDASASVVSQVLETALEQDLLPASIAACEVLEDLADPSILSSGTHRPSSIVNALLYGDRHLQYAAVRAIAAVNPQKNFAGSSYFAQSLVYMSNFVERPAALVGNAREDLARTLAARVGPSGLGGLTAPDGREFFRMATENANLQFLLICDNFHRPDYAEVVQRLRQDWRTKRMPIAILYRSENQSRAERVARDDELTIAMPFTVNSELVDLQVQRLRGFTSVWPVTIDDRRLHAEFSLQWLAKAANGGEAYSYLNLPSFEPQLDRLIFTPGAEGVASDIIASLGTRQSQRTLVDYASESALPMEARQRAAKGFQSSVQSNGILLKSSEIQRQYDRYNASEQDTRESQKVLGDILDAIEARARRKR